MAYGLHTYASRWARERLRTPAIAAVQEGSVLRRRWEGELHEVLCQIGYWVYRGNIYPTLYAVVMEITGGAERPRPGGHPRQKRKMSNWSACVFFRLRDPNANV